MMRELYILLLSILCLIPILLFSSIHQVKEGHIGVYYFGGALLDTTTDPGYHFKLPITYFDNVQITIQTDTVRSIPCGTSGGVMIEFDKIEVVNRLSKDKAWNTIKYYGVDYDKTWIFDKIHHEINQFCSSHSLQEVYIEQFDRLDEALASALQEDCDKYDTGISIIAIRVTKPKIPNSIEKNYQEIEKQKTDFMIANENQKVKQKQEETQLMSAKMSAEREKQVAMIDAEKKEGVSLINARTAIAEKEAQKARALIDNEIYLATQKNKAEALRFAIEQEAIGNEAKFTENYLLYTMYQSISNNSKIFFGDSIPKMFVYGNNNDGNIIIPN